MAATEPVQYARNAELLRMSIILTMKQHYLEYIDVNMFLFYHLLCLFLTFLWKFSIDKTTFLW